MKALPSLTVLYRETGIAPDPALRNAGNACRLYDELAHLHGLTRTVQPVPAACCLLAAPAERLRGRGVSAAQLHRRLRRALPDLCDEHWACTSRLLDLCLDPAAPSLPRHACGRKPADPEAAVFWRLLAIVRAARAPAAGDRDGRIAAIRDDGGTAQVLLTGGRADGHAALDEARALWRRLMLRPLVFTVCADEPLAREGLIQPSDPAPEAGRRILQRHLEQFLSRRYGLAYPADIEFVHEMRVATRRLRAALRVFGRAFDGALPDIKDRLRGLTDSFGESRDCDVFVTFLRHYRGQPDFADSPFLQRMIRGAQRRRRVLYGELNALVGSARCHRFLTGLYRRLCEPIGSPGGIAAHGELGAVTIAKLAPAVLGKGLKRVMKYRGRLTRHTPEDLHRLRIACKKLRYAAEFLADVYPDRLEDLVAPALRMQRTLGDVHDADVYAARLRYLFQKCRSGDRAELRRGLDAVVADLRRRRKRALKRADAGWRELSSAPQRKRLKRLIAAPLG